MAAIEATRWGDLRFRRRPRKDLPDGNALRFPYIDILRYGGKIPGQPEGTAEFCCSDADTIMVFRAEIVPEEDE